MAVFFYLMDKVISDYKRVREVHNRIMGFLGQFSNLSAVFGIKLNNQIVTK